MRDARTTDAPWYGYRQKFRVFFREATSRPASRLWQHVLGHRMVPQILD
jgi:hypothetical protein